MAYKTVVTLLTDILSPDERIGKLYPRRLIIHRRQVNKRKRFAQSEFNSKLNVG